MDSTEVLIKNILDRVQAIGDRVEDIACKQTKIETIVAGFEKGSAKKWYQDINIRYLLAAAALLVSIGRYTADLGPNTPTKSCVDDTSHRKRASLDSLLLKHAGNFVSETKEK